MCKPRNNGKGEFHTKPTAGRRARFGAGNCRRPEVVRGNWKPVRPSRKRADAGAKVKDAYNFAKIILSFQIFDLSLYALKMIRVPNVRGVAQSG